LSAIIWGGSEVIVYYWVSKLWPKFESYLEDYRYFNPYFSNFDSFERENFDSFKCLGNEPKIPRNTLTKHHAFDEITEEKIKYFTHQEIQR
jgi:hypothetical protein